MVRYLFFGLDLIQVSMITGFIDHHTQPIRPARTARFRHVARPMVVRACSGIAGGTRRLQRAGPRAGGKGWASKQRLFMPAKLRRSHFGPVSENDAVVEAPCRMGLIFPYEGIYGRIGTVPDHVPDQTLSYGWESAGELG